MSDKCVEDITRYATSTIIQYRVIGILNVITVRTCTKRRNVPGSFVIRDFVSDALSSYLRFWCIALLFRSKIKHLYSILVYLYNQLNV